MKICHVLVGALLVVGGCKGKKDEANNQKPVTEPAAASAAPAAASAAPAPAAAPAAAAAAPAVAATKRTPEELVKELADPAKVVAIAGNHHASYMQWNDKGEALTQGATCIDEDKFAQAVATLAKAAAAAGVNCNGNICVHYKDDDTKNAFVFRADGTLEGLLENIETSDAAGTDDEVATLHEQHGVVCPKSVDDEAAEFKAKNPA